MNKVINISINGMVFSVEEHAYGKLNGYLESLKRKFSKEEGGEEILSDIEARIAELLLDKNRGRKEVITEIDIEEVMNAMGMPEDLEGGQEEQAYSGSAGTYNNSRSYTYTTGKRIYRDEDNKILGGVCAGLGAYFGIDYVWIRVAFLIAVIFGFGSGIIIYIVMWVIIPPARTAAEKLEMRGEKVNIENIEKAFRDNLGNFKKKMNEWGDEVQYTAHRHSSPIARNAGSAAATIIRLIAKIIAVFASFIGILLLVSIILAILAFSGVINGNVPLFISDIFEGNTESVLFFIGSGLVICLPILAIVTGIAAFLSGGRFRSRWLNLSFFILWIGGFVLVVYTGYNMAARFQYSATVTEIIDLPMPLNDTLHLTIQQDEEDVVVHNNLKLFRHSIRYYEGRNDFHMGQLKLDIERSPDQGLHIREKKRSHGISKDQAKDFSRAIAYSVITTDSSILFPADLSLGPGQKWRGQKLSLNLLVPTGKVIIMHKSMEDIIYNVANTRNMYDRDMIGYKWLMTEQGLHCIDCPKQSANMYE